MAARPSPIELAKSVRRFGIAHGVANCVRATLPRRAATCLWISPDRSVELRRRTSDWETFSEVFLDECYRDDFADLFGTRRPAESVHTVIDAGANVGYASIYFRRRYPNSSVWAIEPDADNYRELVRNTQADARVHPIFGALWDSHERIAVNADRTASNAVQVRKSQGRADNLVQGYTMSDMLEMLPDRHIDVLKVDVEGAERFIFGANADCWLEHVDLIFIELHDWKEHGSSRAYHEALHPFDYSEFSIGGTLGTVIHGRRNTEG